MARLFNDAANDILERSSAVVTAYPFTAMGWAYIDDATVESALWACQDRDVVNQFWRIVAFLATGLNRLLVSANAGSTTVTAQTTTGFTVNTWFHWAGVFTSATSRTIYLNAGGNATQTTSRTPTGLDSTTIGGSIQSIAVSRPTSGRVDYVGVWNVALGLNEITAGARGVHPLRIRRDALIDLRILGLFDPEPNIVEPGNTMTVTGTTRANGAPVELLLRPSSLEETAAPAVGLPSGSMMLTGAGR